MSLHSPLHEELDRLAERQPPFRPDPALWDRGRRGRRRTRVATGAAALALIAVVGAVGAPSLRPEALGPAAEEVPEGAIPTRIVDLPSDAPEIGQDALDVGRASVAYLSPDKGLVLIGADDGSYHHADVPHRLEGGSVRLSPDGTRLAYVYAHAAPDDPTRTEAGVAVVRLSDGDIVQVPAALPGDIVPASITSVSWSADSTWIAWTGRQVRSWAWGEGPVLRGGRRDVVGAVEVDRLEESVLRGQATMEVPGPAVAGVAGPFGYVTFASREKVGTFVPDGEGSGGGGVSGPWTADASVLATLGDAASSSPTNALMAVGVTTAGRAAIFVTEEGGVLERRLDESLYPQGAEVTPLGWADDSLVVASVDAPPGSAAEGRHLTLFTSPDRPESEWIYRILVRDLPASVTELSVAVDLIPDLDGTSTQVLTRDFPPPDWDGSLWRERLPYVLGGLMALLAGLAYIRMVRLQASRG